MCFAVSPLRCVVARRTDDGSARYSSVRQLSHISSEHDTLGQTPSAQAPSQAGLHCSSRSKASRRKDSIPNSSNPPRRHGAPKSIAQTWFGPVGLNRSCRCTTARRRPAGHLRSPSPSSLYSRVHQVLAHLPALAVQQHTGHAVAIAHPGLGDLPDTHAQLDPLFPPALPS